MSNLIFTAIGALGRAVQSHSSAIPSSIVKQAIVFSQTRNNSKHWDPKFKKLRAQKVIKIKLPNFHESEEIRKEKFRSKMKEHGLVPAKPWIEQPIYLSATGSIFEPYVPPEGDGKFSAVSKEGAKQKVEFMTKKGKSYMAVRKIGNYEDGFSITEFEQEAQQVYIKAHEAIANKDQDGLRQYVTERAYPEVEHNTRDKTIRWKFLESLEMPRSVHARCTHLIAKDNMFAQVTVRFHTQQSLAVYDRFGRLMHGSEIVKKDVLEYIVFEKHLSNQYGSWRIHAKIIPSWMPEREYSERTLMVEPEKPKQAAVTPETTAPPPPEATANPTNIQPAAA